MSVCDDAFAACARTHATLRVVSGDVDPDEVTRALGVEPDAAQRRGDPADRRGLRRVLLNTWSLSSQGKVESRDLRRHLDWLLERLGPDAGPALARLRAAAGTADVTCYWLSATGSGGPLLGPAQTRRLADLGLDVWFDVYFGGSSEPAAARPVAGPG